MLKSIKKRKEKERNSSNEKYINGCSNSSAFFPRLSKGHIMTLIVNSLALIVIDMNIYR